MYSLNQIAFVKWIHITCLIYCFLQPQAALFWDVSASFKFFLLIIKREPDGAAFVLASKNRLPNQVYSKKTEIKLWIHLHLAKVHRLKELNSPYIVCTLFWLYLNFRYRWSFNWFDTTYVWLVFCLSDLRTCTLVYKIKIKTNASRLYGAPKSAHFLRANTQISCCKWIQLIVAVATCMFPWTSITVNHTQHTSDKWKILLDWFWNCSSLQEIWTWFLQKMT